MLNSIYAAIGIILFVLTKWRKESSNAKRVQERQSPTMR